MRAPGSKLRLAAVGDLHVREDHGGRFRQMIKDINHEADLLLLCGDLTDKGTEAEARVLAEELSGLRVPCCAVFGNHDYEAGKADEVKKILTKESVHVLDGDHFIFDHTLGVAGIKGFGGGYNNATLQAFGETHTKAFVQEAVNESLKLEAALGQIDTPLKVVIMHYSPIVQTVVGENPEIRAFLGCSRLGGPVDRYGAEAIFHGHAHHGTLEGKTDRGVPVFNVAYPLLRRTMGDARYRILELTVPARDPAWEAANAGAKAPTEAGPFPGSDMAH